MDRAKDSVGRAGLAINVLEDNVESVMGRVSVGTMHLAKGLEFRAVAVLACDDEVIPSQSRIEAAGEESGLVYNTERHLLYVACTRARDFLLVSGSAPVSEFLEDLAGKRIEGAKAG
jgi:superfamily I DNA/RNA helicase